MLFNTFPYAVFLPVVFIVYWFVLKKNLRLQNLFLLLASYYFYSCWDWRFLFLLAFTTILDFWIGLKINSGTEKSAKAWMWFSIAVNIGVLGIFKYFNFFSESFADLLGNFGIHFSPWVLNIILPVGISFYTFHGLSYIIDLYRKKIPVERNFVNYALFVSFFPLLVAGPIERGAHLLPQIKVARRFDFENAMDGLRQILWGLFKKMVIADNCAAYADILFSQPGSYEGAALFFGAIMFAFQIYGDFSGYTDIAAGTARLFGFDLLKNFSYPYFSKSIGEFWKRWHISLSSWFRDYLYIPLGGSRISKAITIRNVFIIFLVSGFWHGANWTFIFWGLLHAVFYLPSVIVRNHRTKREKQSNARSFLDGFSILGTFLLVTLAWIVFRAADIRQAFQYIYRMIAKLCSPDGFHQLSELLAWRHYYSILLLSFLILFYIIEWKGRHLSFPLQQLQQRWSGGLRYGLYVILCFIIFWFSGSSQQFIYFQF
ncbi:MAG: MBOAT family protein [Taibaiella sp.]|nr:MBOAT family protein [Taibaiella sp.]